MSLGNIASRAAKRFPGNTRVGVDLCYVPRIRKWMRSYEKDDGDKTLLGWLRRCFRHEELKELRDWMSKHGGSALERRRDSFAFHLAGRWAAKEAGIKAVRCRKIYPADVWVLSTTMGPPEILIAPPNRPVTMTPEVAERRGLGPSKFPKDCSTTSTDETGWTRWHRPRMEEFQLAEGSISHDGNYAIAMVQAVNEHLDDSTIVDDGHGKPIHRPLQRDQGFEVDPIPSALLKSYLNDDKYQKGTPETPASSDT